MRRRLRIPCDLIAERVEIDTGDLAKAKQASGAVIEMEATAEQAIKQSVAVGAAAEETSANVQEAAQGTQQVTSNLDDVRQGAGVTASSASQVLSAAQDPSRHSERLGREVATFLAGVTAA